MKFDTYFHISPSVFPLSFFVYLSFLLAPLFMHRAITARELGLPPPPPTEDRGGGGRGGRRGAGRVGVIMMHTYAALPNFQLHAHGPERDRRAARGKIKRGTRDQNRLGCFGLTTHNLATSTPHHLPTPFQPL
jgi:hypothetical protein